MYSVEIDPETHFYLKHLQFKTMGIAIKKIITENKILKIEIGQLKSKLKGEHDFLKEAHIASVSRPIMLGQSQAQYIPTQNNFPTPPPPSKMIPQGQPRKMIEFKPSEDLKADLVKESSMIFDGQIRSPSEILKLCKPKHEESIVVEFEGDEPSLMNTSHIIKLIKNESSEVEKFKKTIKI